IGVARRNNLRKAHRRIHGARAAAGRERKYAALVGRTAGLDLLLGLTHPGDLRCGVDDRGYDRIIDVRVAPRDAIGHRDALFLALVRQHRATHAITDGPHALRAGATFRIDTDEPALIELDPAVGRQQIRRVGAATNGDDDLVDRQGLRTLAVGVLHGHAVLAALGARDPRAEADIESLLFEVTRSLRRQLLVGDGEEIVERLENRDLCAQAAPHAAELQTDHARADHAQPLRYAREFQRIPGVADALMVKAHGRQLGRDRAAGEDHVLRCDLGARTVMPDHLDATTGEQARAP